MQDRLVVGVDEAGRGPLAGPVSVGVAVVPVNFKWSDTLPDVTDSKKICEMKREEIFMKARRLKAAGQLDFAVSMVSAKVIDRIGIARAIALAMARAISRLTLDPDNVHIKLDGSLYAPAAFASQETIIKGDLLEPVIGLASICAKVTRDRYMVRTAKKAKYVQYDFGTHKGYGTKAHRTAITEFGFSHEHRKTYCKNIRLR